MKSFAFISACLFSVIGFSQTNNNIIPSEPIKPAPFSIGIKGGYGHSFIMPYSDYAYNSSWDGGISFIYAPWKHFGVGLDALYSSEGASFKISDDIQSVQLNYIRVPVKAIYFFRDYEKDFRPKIAIGPTIGFLMNESNNGQASFLDVGANASLGFNYRLARAIWFNADASYYNGFTDIYSGNTLYDFNGNIRLDLGISFGF